MDLKSFAEVYWSMQEGKVNPGLQAYLDKKKGKKDNGDEKEEENGKESKGSKPDFLDLDKDGDKKEPMKKAAKEKKEETEYNYVNSYAEMMAPRMQKGAMAYDGPNKAASEAKDRVMQKTKTKQAMMSKEDIDASDVVQKLIDSGKFTKEEIESIINS